MRYWRNNAYYAPWAIPEQVKPIQKILLGSPSNGKSHQILIETEI
ncbi:hypothetical protein [Pseudanabaena sp. FACHB-1998]|nr:hypothetical protein [Pseudanabaena sp. FACHB-1998]